MEIILKESYSLMWLWSGDYCYGSRWRNDASGYR